MEFNSLGGRDQTRCAPGDPDSGVTALRGAGFEPTRAAQEAGYFVCRIDGKPADDPCQRASPEDAYWSYWHAQPGGTWSFSNAGAAEYDPAPGTVEGWSFGAGEPPSTPPPARKQPQQQPAATTAPPPAPAASAPPRTRAPAAAATSSPPRTATAPATQAPAPATSAAPTVRASALPSATTAPSPAPSAETVLTVDDPASPEEGGSPLVGVLLAVAVVAGLGAAAAFQAQKRR